MTRALEGKVAFITGASQGIGRECALVLAEAGATVALGARNQEKLAGVAREAEALGAPAAAFPLELADGAQIESAFRAARERFGKIDILVNNAGITRDTLAMRMKRDDWDAVLQTNLTGAYLCIRQVLNEMVRARWGRIINITSIVGQTGNPGQANYVASKAGLIGLTRALALEVASRSITVNAVSPGFIDTAMTQKLSEDTRAKLLERIPLGRIGSARDVAAAVRFLASDDAGYITGHVLNVNGGLYLG